MKYDHYKFQDEAYIKPSMKSPKQTKMVVAQEYSLTVLCPVVLTLDSWESFFVDSCASCLSVL